MKIAIFGAGVNGRKLIKLPRQNNVEIVAIMDNDIHKVGCSIDDIPVIFPGSAHDIYLDAILVSNEWVHEVYQIINQLMDLGFPQSMIFNTYRLEMSHYMNTEMDNFFVIEKYQNTPFKKSGVLCKEDYGYICETEKAYERRKREGFFEKYCCGEGLDIGYGPFLISPDASGWEYKNGDAQYLAGVDDESFDYVYSSHCLEHMVDVRVALRSWFRVVRKGGYLIIAVPERDLYEKRLRLPSRWNIDHKHMFLIGRAESPDTLDLVEEIRESLSNYEIQYVKRCNEGCTVTDPDIHSDGEYQIEVVIKKKKEKDFGYEK